MWSSILASGNFPSGRARRRASASTGVAGAVLCALLAMALAPWLFSPHSPETVDMARALQPPSARHWFGTDDVGRDLFARLIHGTRVTLGTVGAALLVAAALGSICGLLAGHLRGWKDTVLSRAADALMSFPPLVLGVIVTGVLSPGLDTVALALVVIYTPMFFRVLRGAALRESSLAYLEAARALGLNEWNIAWRHLLRNLTPTALTQYVVLFPLAVQIEAALGFLGLGVQPPTPDWGATLHSAKDFITTAPWLALFPGLFLLLATLSVHLLARPLKPA